jgi:putative endonuclease
LKWPFSWWRSRSSPLPDHLQRGQAGELAARRHLEAAGLRFLAGNYRGKEGELDLVMRDGDCLVFVEVKARKASSWSRPASAVTIEKQRRVSATALQYLNELGRPPVKVRFDIVEVILRDGQPEEVQHLIHAFPLHRRYLYH